MTTLDLKAARKHHGENDQKKAEQLDAARRQKARAEDHLIAKRLGSPFAGGKAEQEAWRKLELQAQKK